MKKRVPKRILSLLLALVMCFGLIVPASAAETKTPGLRYEQVDNSTVTAKLPEKRQQKEQEREPLFQDSDEVRVSIVLKDKSTLENLMDKGASAENLASNTAAMNYRRSLEQKQNDLAQMISQKALNGVKLDVVWNMTLVANMISANVQYGQIEAIRRVPGVEQVLLETQYAPAVVHKDEKDDPNMSTSAAQIGSAAAYAAGYTGAGSRLAIIDTGVDTAHQSFSGDGYTYALEQLAEEKGMSKDAYVAGLNLLDAAEIAQVLPELNAYKRTPDMTAEDLYINAKVAYGYNYVDQNLNVGHLYDTKEEHGSHVAGIATANSYIPDGNGGYVRSLDDPNARVQGVAPDAQLFAMKVFGQNGGAYDSDYMVAVEDAIMLGADSINLSLGSAVAGMSTNTNDVFQGILEDITESGTVVVMSAGNSGYWASQCGNVNGMPYLYSDGVDLDTVGSPGSFTNTLATASVDNAGFTSSYLILENGSHVVFQENPGKNKPMASLEGDHEYVLVDGIGSPEDFAALGDAVQGKVAACARGELSFFEKANNAMSAGAIALIVYNNEPTGVINMNLDGYTYDAPCVFVTGNSGDRMREAAEPVTNDAGETVGYVGKLTVPADGLSSEVWSNGYNTISEFSSWGVPGTLKLKPEITAPGGGIYSVNGTHKSAADGSIVGGDYENMSGTSMAAPQITGMAALIGQYIRENGLDAKTGLTARQLAQSLLMSTAKPQREEANDGGYYSVLAQGAGLADVGQAVAADSYILMKADATESYFDGKVKAELGDDPARNGSYTFSFSVNNLTDESCAYDLSADLFTQGVFDYEEMYMDTWTVPMMATAQWTVNGQPLNVDTQGMENLDFNGDGKVTNGDCTAMLEYVTGVRSSLFHQENADLDENGEITSYDAYLFLKRVSAGALVVPANGSVDVTVTLSLTDEQKAELNDYYPVGAYVEGYVYVQPVATAEGAVGSVHSIPVLGFYGNWSDASMFDVGTLVDFWYGNEYRLPYLPDSAGDPEMFHNYMSVKYADEGGEYFYFGNPLTDDDEYLPERNAFNNENGDALYKYYYALIRNAAAMKYQITDVDTGEVYLEELYDGTQFAAYYDDYGNWYNTEQTFKMNWKGTDADGGKLPEGTRVNIDLAFAPEYYANGDGTYDWDAMGEGVALSTMTTIDNTAPVIDDVAMSLTEDDTLIINATDNQYIAVAALYDVNGAKELTYTAPNQTVAGQQQVIKLDVSKVTGKTFLVKVYDYAMNAVTLKITCDLVPELDAHYNFFDMGKRTWYGYTEDGQEFAPMGKTPLLLYAADYACGYVFAIDANNDLYVMPVDDYGNYTYIAHIQDDDVLDDSQYEFFVSDMAYSVQDDTMYALVYSDANGLGYSYLITVDMLTGEAEVLGEMGQDVWTLAIDEEGNFYGEGTFDNILYKFTKDTFTEPEALGELPGEVSIFMAQCAYAWDSDNDNLVMTLATSDLWTGQILSSEIFTIDPETLEVTKLADHANVDVTIGAFVKNGPASSDKFAPTDKASRVELSTDSLMLLRGESGKLEARVLPWTVENKDVRWTSSDPSVASVTGNGTVIAHHVGECQITAASAADPTVTAVCDVMVYPLELEASGVLQTADGDPVLYTWNFAESDTWTAGADMETYLTAAAYDAYTDTLFVQDDEGVLKKVDQETGKTLAVSNAPTAGGAIDDITVMQAFIAGENEPLLMGVYGSYLLAPTTFQSNDFSGAWNLGSWLSNNGATGFVGLTSTGIYDEELGELILALDNAGVMWTFYINGTSLRGGSCFTSLPELEYPTYADMQNCSLVMADDGSVLFSYFDGETNQVYWLIPMETADGDLFFEAKLAGDFGDGVWPAPICEAHGPASAFCMSEEQMFSNVELMDTVMNQDSFTMEREAAAKTEKTEKNLKQTILTGSLNSDVSNRKAAATSDELLRGRGDLVVLDVTAQDARGRDTASNNGKMTVSYDPDQFELVSVQVNSAFYSYNDQTDGKVVFAYADLQEIPAGTPAATLCLERKGYSASNIFVKHEELNDTKPGYEERVHISGTWIPGGSIASGGTSHSGSNLPFTDVNKGDWFYDAVAYVYGEDLMLGTSDVKFSPNMEFSRAMVTQILYRLEGKPAVEYKATFSDVADGQWYTDAVLWANSQGIVLGYNTGKFGPNDSVTVEQPLLILQRYAKSEGCDVSAAMDPAYKLDGKVSPFAVDAAKWAVAEDLLSRTLVPTAPATRAQVAEILMNFCEEIL